MLYVVPEALPRDYAWQIHGEAVTDVVWVGMRLNRKGRLEGAGTVFAAMEKQSTQPPAPALEIHSREKLAHHQLIGLTSTDAGAQILRDAPTRRASQTALLQLLKNSPQVAGLQLDFEYLPPQYAAAFVSYIRELRAALPREAAQQATAPLARTAHRPAICRASSRSRMAMGSSAPRLHRTPPAADRAQTIASIQRIKQIQKNLKATVIIQHDPRDVGKLPAFPAAAK